LQSNNRRSRIESASGRVVGALQPSNLLESLRTFAEDTVRHGLVSLFVLHLAAVVLGAEEYPFIKADVYHRYVQVPLDHGNPKAGTFTLYYELGSNFDFKKPTVFYIVDSQQYAHGADQMAKQGSLDRALNLVLIEYRGRKHSPIALSKEDGSVDWEKAYRLTASHQAARDIEAVRRDLFRDHPKTKIYLLGRSGGAYLIHEYLSLFPKNASRAFTRTAPNPLIMHKLGNPESKSFVDGLDAIDPQLHAKLKTVFAQRTVPAIELEWLLLQLPYRDPTAPEIQARIINELYAGDTTTYEQYHAKWEYNMSRFDRDGLVRDMGVGWLARAIECDGPYLLGPKPEYVDPVYSTMRHISAPYLKLIEEQGFPPPKYPTLESFRAVEAEVYYLAGRKDHMSPWPIALELARWFPRYSYFIADDTHNMSERPECYPLLYNAFFLHGLGSAELAQAEQSDVCKRWTPPSAPEIEPSAASAAGR
jgi:pimeloyl-ACP methyl ester carboxylesterase